HLAHPRARRPGRARRRRRPPPAHCAPDAQRPRRLRQGARQLEEGADRSRRAARRRARRHQQEARPPRARRLALLTPPPNTAQAGRPGRPPVSAAPTVSNVTRCVARPADRHHDRRVRTTTRQRGRDGRRGPPRRWTRKVLLPMDNLDSATWRSRCALRIAELDHEISRMEAERLAKDIYAFERTRAMGPE